MSTFLTRHRDKIAMLTGFAAQAVHYGSALLLLLFVVTRLDRVEAEIWYIFVTIQGLAMLADFGFQPTVTRAFAAAYAGATEIRREGLSETNGGAPNHALIVAILGSTRRLYAFLAIATAVVLLSVGMFYVSSLVRDDAAVLRTVQWSWVLFSLGIALNIYLLWIAPFFVGAGRLTSNYVSIILNKGGFALLGVGILLAGGDLLALAIANIAAALVARLCIARGLRRLIDASEAGTDVAANAAVGGTREMLKLIWPNASRMGAVALGTFCITRVNVLILSTFVGLSESASYAVTLQLLSAVLAIGQLPTIAALPTLVRLRMEGRLAIFWTMFVRRQVFLLGSAALGIVVLALIGQGALTMVGSTVMLLDRNTILLLGLILLLDFNHSNCGFFISTGNTVPYVVPMVASGVVVTILASIAAYAGYGVIGVIAVQGVVQLAYNNWKWPLVLYRELGPEARLRRATGPLGPHDNLD